MKTTLLLIITLLGLCACTTSAVKMSPEETQSFFAENTDLARAQEEEGFNKVNATTCDTKSGPCWKVECIGSNCWKTEMETPPEGMFEKPTNKPAIAKAQCESTSESSAVRRKGCYDYMNYLGEYNSTASINESVRVLNTMCNFNGVSCKKNYNKFGSGTLSIDDSRKHYKSGQLKIYTYVSSGAKTVIVYDYSVLL